MDVRGAEASGAFLAEQAKGVASAADRATALAEDRGAQGSDLRAGALDEVVIARVGAGLGGVLRLIESEAATVRVNRTQDSPERLLLDLLSRSERDERERAARDAEIEAARDEGRALAETVRPEREGGHRERVHDAGAAVDDVGRGVVREAATAEIPGTGGDVAGFASGFVGGPGGVVVASENASASLVQAGELGANVVNGSERIRELAFSDPPRASKSLTPSRPDRLLALLG